MIVKQLLHKLFNYSIIVRPPKSYGFLFIITRPHILRRGRMNLKEVTAELFVKQKNCLPF